jgi:hypothetical protein
MNSTSIAPRHHVTPVLNNLVSSADGPQGKALELFPVWKQYLCTVLQQIFAE